MRTSEEMQELYDKYKYLIEVTIYKQGYGQIDFLELHGLTKDDLIQHGRLGLNKACKEHDSTKTASFRSFAISNIIWAINVESIRESLSRDKSWSFNTINRVSFDSILPNSLGEQTTLHDLISDGEPHEMAENVEVDESLQAIEKVVSEKTMSIINMKLKGMTNAQVGEALGVTHQNVSYILRKNKDKIKNAVLA